MRFLKEKLNWQVKWIIWKYKNEKDYLEGLPYKTEIFKENGLCNIGIQELLDLLCGLGSPTAYNSANAQVGVSDDTTPSDPTQTALDTTGLGNENWIDMDSGSPTRTNQTISFEGTFGPDDANHAWESFGVRNGAIADKLLNRKVESKGTKPSGEVWTLKVEITIS